jgi:hypothetical protein
MYNKRAQMEIFGLVVIVILLAIGLLFAIIILTKTPTREVQRVKESVQAANFLNTMMSTTSVGCGKRSARELLQNCALATKEWVGATECENGQNTCELFRSMVAEMLTKTLGEWGKNYRFYITGTEAAEEIKIEAGPCEGEREGSTRQEKIRPGLDVEVTLHLCQS